MATRVDELRTNAVRFRNNPANIQRLSTALLREINGGTWDLVDPTNPFAHTLELGACLASASMMENEANCRRLYPLSAQSEDDLYRHMTDRDYADRFALPASAKISMMMPLDEVESKLVEDVTTGIKKLVIPRNTYFNVGEVIFSIQYPVEVRKYQHGGLQVVYDATVVSPLETLTTNVIPHRIARGSISGEMRDYILFELDTQQFSIVSQQNSVNLANDFRATVDIIDHFYYARVYVKNSDSQTWKEIATTHSQQVYDPLKATAVIRVLGKQVQVSIPQIYVTSGLVSGAVRIDIYQTRGPLEMELHQYPNTAFQVVFENFDKTENDEFVAPTRSLREILIFSAFSATGGRAALPFDELRDRVINNVVGPQQQPITNVALEATLSNIGYDVIRNIDLVTGRAFLATRNMPIPNDTKLITAAAASIETVQLLAREAIAVDSVIDNGTSITITPDTIFKLVNGVTSIVPTAELNYLLSLEAEKRALAVSQGSYLFTPFHMVLDMGADEFEARPYYLDDPETASKSFVAQNDTTLLQVSVDTYLIRRTATGFQMEITTLSGASFKDLLDGEVHVQLSYIPPGERERAYLNGVLSDTTADGERVYTFDLATNFNVDKGHNLLLTKFKMFDTEERITPAQLITDFDIVFSTSAVMSELWEPSATDDILGRFILPTRIAAITHETINTRFGYALRTLWARARSAVETLGFQTWEMDVQKFYEEDVYERDESGVAVFTVEDDVIVFNILHHKDDPVLDNEGEPVYLHRAGDVKLVDGEPVPKNVRGMARMVDLFLIEGAYWFATDVSSARYKKAMILKLVDWLINDLGEMSKLLLEHTRLYFVPKKTTGTIEVLDQDTVLRTISASQSFRLVLYVSEQVYVDVKLRERLRQTSIEILDTQLAKRFVANDKLQKALGEAYGEEVSSVQLSGLGGDNPIQAFTVVDDSQRCSIRRRLKPLPDGTLIVEEDITCDFVRHDLSVL